MKLTVLGCDYPYAAPGGVGSSYLVEHEGKHLLINCGPGSLAQLTKTCLFSQIDAIVLSDLTGGNTSDLYVGYEILRELQAYHAIHEPVHIFLNLWAEETRRRIRCSRGIDVFAFHGFEYYVETGSRYSMGNMQMELTYLPSFGIKIRAQHKKLVYVAELEECAETVKFCSGADLLLCGMYGSMGEVEDGRSDSAWAGELARAAKVRRMIGVDIHPYADCAGMLSGMRESFPEAQLAETGMTVEI